VLAKGNAQRLNSTNEVCKRTWESFRNKAVVIRHPFRFKELPGLRVLLTLVLLEIVPPSAVSDGAKSWCGGMGGGCWHCNTNSATPVLPLTFQSLGSGMTIML